MVPEEGVEPTHSCEYGIMSRLYARDIGRSLDLRLRLSDAPPSIVACGGRLPYARRLTCGEFGWLPLRAFPRGTATLRERQFRECALDRHDLGSEVLEGPLCTGARQFPKPLHAQSTGGRRRPFATHISMLSVVDFWPT